MYLELPREEIQKIVNRFRPTEERMTAIGMYAREQTKDRFVRGGAPDKPWPHPKWRAQVGHDDGRAILTGPTGDLLRSFHVTASEGEANMGSPAKYARVHQLGCRSKGGQLADIKPRKARALFIPLSARAEQAEVRSASSMRRERRAPNGDKLIQGKFVKGKIVPANADYTYLSRVSLPPRPMLPTAEPERKEQARFVTETLKS